MRGICPECKVREEDSSVKDLVLCFYCDRLFCDRHVPARLASFSSPSSLLSVKDRGYRQALYDDMQKRDSHPCVPYTLVKSEEMKLDKAERIRVLNELLEKPLSKQTTRKRKTQLHASPRRSRANGGQILGGILFFIVGSAILTVLFNPQLLLPIPTDLRELEAQVFALINRERNDRDLAILENNSKLVGTAQGWSRSMLGTRVLEHGDFGGRMDDIGYLGRYQCGEICEMIAGHRTGVAEKLVQGWLNSPGHREIMLTDREGQMGVGIAGRGDTYYATVDFIFYD